MCQICANCVKIRHNSSKLVVIAGLGINKTLFSSTENRVLYWLGTGFEPAAFRL